MRDADEISSSIMRIYRNILLKYEIESYHSLVELVRNIHPIG